MKPKPPKTDHGNEARLRAVVKTAVDGVILIDALGTVLMFNPACERLFGYRAAEVIGRNVKMLMPPPEREEHDEYIAAYRHTGKCRIIGIGREVMAQRKDGTTFPVNLSVGESKTDAETNFVGIIHDLTERKRAERALQESASRLRAVVETAVDGVILIDSRGIVQMFNPACERLFGYRAEEIVGENVGVLMPSPYREEHDEYIANYLSTGEAKVIGIGREVVGRRKDGTTFPMDLSVGEARQGGESAFVGVVHDLTERKRFEEQLVQAQKMEAVGQLSGGIAHDFNNLLTVILGNAEALTDALKARPDLYTLANAIAIAGERGAELTRRLLAFSRRQALRPVEVDCNGLIRSMGEILRRTLREDIEMDTTLDSDLWTAFADPGQLESAILNLALNARDAMPDGGWLSIVTSNMPLDGHYQDANPEVPAGRYVMIALTDSGDGMPPEVRERAFEPFYTTKEVGRGSGLGLSMVYGFVKQSNGHISIYSERGLGTTVRMYLPAISTAPASMHGGARDREPAVPGGREAVLVAEDDSFVRSFAVDCLKSLGYRVIAAADGQEALARLSHAPDVDLLFTDIVMPGGLDGWGLAARAHEAAPGLKVLFTSGYPLEALAAHGRLRPGTPFIAKPYRKADLARAVREALSRAAE